MRRDGQFYLIDAFFAAAIVFIGVGFLVTDFVSAPRGEQARIASLDMADLLFDTPINDILIPTIRNQYALYDVQLSPMAQIQVWLEYPDRCSPNCEELSEQLVGLIVGDLLPVQHSMNITLATGAGTFYFERIDPLAADRVLLINSRRMLFTVFPGPGGDDILLGPDLVEVRVWV